jgi:nicotinamidase/pyrazinamidase
MKFNKEEVAAFDVDAQKGFSARCPEELPVEGAEGIVFELEDQAAYAKFRVGSKDNHPQNAAYAATPQEPQFTPVKGLENVDIRWNAHCVSGTAGAQLLDGLPHPQDYDFFVWKGNEPDMHPYGACYHDLHDKISTGVIEWLQTKGVKAVIVGGLATDFCVAKTIQQLLAAGLEVIVNKAACRGIWAQITEEKQMQKFKDWGCTVIENFPELKHLIKLPRNPLEVLAGYAVQCETQGQAEKMDKLLDLDETFAGTWDQDSNLLVVFKDASCQGFFATCANDSKIIDAETAFRMLTA